MTSPVTAAPPRVACPACGAAIHPIAGRCRHCRVDVSRSRVDGPAAAAGLAPPRATRRSRLAVVAFVALAIGIAVAAAAPLGAI